MLLREDYVPDITVVLNYNFAGNIEKFVHQVDWRRRAGLTSNAYTIITQTDTARASDLIRILTKAEPEGAKMIVGLRLVVSDSKYTQF